MDDIKNVVRIEKTRVIKDYSVGIYARVSTNSKEQLDSLANGFHHGIVAGLGFAQAAAVLHGLGVLVDEDLHRVQGGVFLAMYPRHALQV